MECAVELPGRYVCSLLDCTLWQRASNRRYANTCLALVIENSRCQFNLDLSATETATMRWFDIWAAAIAADVRKSHSPLTLAEKHHC